MKEPYLVIDVAQCENCNNCFLACKDEHVGNDWPGYAAPQQNAGPSWIRIEARERGEYPMIDVAYLPVPCMHCADAPCIKAAREGAIYKRPDGIVMIDPLKAKGQRQVVQACPYHAIVWNEEAQAPQKCTMCAHLLDKGWEKTRCVQSCPTGALSMLFLEPADMEALARNEGPPDALSGEENRTQGLLQTSLPLHPLLHRGERGRTHRQQRRMPGGGGGEPPGRASGAKGNADHRCLWGLPVRRTR